MSALEGAATGASSGDTAAKRAAGWSLLISLHVDYRVLFVVVRVFQPEMVLLLGMYMPFFLPFFLANAFRVNGPMRVEGQPGNGRACCSRAWPTRPACC